jgi:hypothetical protein
MGMFSEVPLEEEDDPALELYILPICAVTEKREGIVLRQSKG